MKIILNVEGQEKEFTNDFVRARDFREALALNERMAEKKDGPLSERFDELAEFVVSVFRNQFTLNELWDGLAANQLQSELMRIFNEVLSLGGFILSNNTEGK